MEGRLAAARGFSHRCGRCRDCLRFFADYQIDCGKVAGSKPCLGYGAKVGLAFIGREALRPDTYADTVHRVAVDIATYDQQSCLAPQTVFVETDGALTLVKWLSCSVASLENQQRKYPRSVLSDAENWPFSGATDAEMRALMGGKPRCSPVP